MSRLPVALCVCSLLAFTLPAASATAQLAGPPVSPTEDAMMPGGDVPTLRTDSSRTFVGPDGSLTAHVYPDTVNYRDRNGSWHWIDNRLTRDGAVLRNGPNRYDLELPADLSAGEITVGVDHSWIAFSPRGADGRARVAEDSARYRGAWRGVDLRYEATGDTVKEDIVVRDLASLRDFAFDLRLPPGSIPTMLGSGVIAIRDQSGRSMPIRLLPSTMVDAAGAQHPVAARLGRSLTGWVLTLRPDRRWLARSERRWPVTIDPQVSVGGTDWCTISDSESYCLDGGPVLVGDTIRSLLHFDVSDALPPGAVVEQAHLTVVRSGGPQETFDVLTAHKVTRPWIRGVTWYSTGYSSDWTTEGGDFAKALPRFDTGAEGLRGWDVTALAGEWASGSENDGVLLTAPPLAEPAEIYGLDSEFGPALEIQYAPTEDPESVVQQVAVEAYVEADGVTTTTAENRLEIQDRVNLLRPALEEAISPALFGGIWFDHADSGRPKVGVKSSAPTPPAAVIEDAVDLLEEHDLTGEVDFVSVEASLPELDQPADSLATDLAPLMEDGKAAVSVSVADNALAVEQVDSLTPAEESLVDDAVDDVDVDVNVDSIAADDLYGTNAANSCAVVSTRLACNAPFRGGTGILGESWCTGGFMSNAPSGKLYLMTAGHCVSPDTYPYTLETGTVVYKNKEGQQKVIGKPFKGQKYYPEGNRVLDAGLITVNPPGSSLPSPYYAGGRWIFVTNSQNPPAGPENDTTRNEWYDIDWTDYPSDGSVYCITGAPTFTSGEHTSCGEVKGGFHTRSIDADPHHPRFALVRIDACGPGHGSSGGPLYKNHIGYGVFAIFTDGTCHKYSTSVMTAQAAFNVVIKPEKK